MKTIIEQTRNLTAQEFLKYVVKRFGDSVALASSMGAEDQVLVDMLCSVTTEPNIFTLDTGRLPQETYDVIDATNKKYGIKIRIAFPEAAKVEQMVNEAGPNLFYESVDARKQCCHIRKVLPLQRELANLDAWITGLRRQQSVTRESLDRVEWDQSNGLIKLSPLADWTQEQVWDYIRSNNVPYSKLHDLGYPSIGCAPCTRAIKEGEDVRAGRWWWETPEQKECGLHVVDGKLVRNKQD